MLNHSKLKCYVMALETAKKLPTLIASWPQGNAYLSDQLKRALSSVILNIAEGNGRRYPKERRRFFSIAIGSASEVSAIIDIVYAYRLIQKTEFDEIQDKLLQIVKMLYKLS